MSGLFSVNLFSGTRDGSDATALVTANEGQTLVVRDISITSLAPTNAELTFYDQPGGSPVYRVQNVETASWHHFDGHQVLGAGQSLHFSGSPGSYQIRVSGYSFTG